MIGKSGVLSLLCIYPTANNRLNLIPHCIPMVQGAGTGAAIAIRDNVIPRGMNFKKLRKTLINQGVYMPGIE